MILDGPIIMLPPHHSRWLVIQPVKFLDFVALQSDRVQLDYVVIDKLVVSNLLYKFVREDSQAPSRIRRLQLYRCAGRTSTLVGPGCGPC
jgi:hypothetical protein